MISLNRIIRRTLVLAHKGAGKTGTNPRVGAVLVDSNGMTLARGFHKGYGMPHAEVECIRNAEKKGITDFSETILFVNLEPCCHWGKTPPCTELIISKKIPHVVFGTLDPFKKVRGKGAAAMRAAGIQVEYGILEEECRDVNRMFFKRIQKRLPFVALKVAQTMDGKIATVNGDSKWITSEKSRKFVHKIRSEFDAILIGAETAKKDNPSLTLRRVRSGQPFRVIVDGRLSVSEKLKLFNDRFADRTILCTSESSSKKKIVAFEKKGIRVWRFSTVDSRIALRQILKRLLNEGQIASVLVEGGGRIFGQFIREKLADEIHIFIAPKILGDGLSAFSTDPLMRIGDALDIHNCSIKKSGTDFYVRADFKW